MDDPRLTRIETKLDKLADAMNTLVRVEERVTTIFKRLDLIDQRQTDFADRIDGLERTSDGRGHLLRFLERIFWIVLTAAVGAAFVYLRGV